MFVCVHEREKERKIDYFFLSAIGGHWRVLSMEMTYDLIHILQRTFWLLYRDWIRGKTGSWRNS